MDSSFFVLVWADKAFILIYLILIWAYGIYGAKPKSDEDFILGGRSLSLPAFISTLVATWYGGVLGVGEFCYRHGLSSWVVMGVPYYCSAALFAVFLARKVRASSCLTIPERLRNHYGERVALFASGVIFIHTMPASKVLMLGILLQMIFGWPLSCAIIIGTFFSIIYIFVGGFKAVVKTDVLQFILMLLSFIIILPFAVLFSKETGISILDLPGNFLSLRGDIPLGYALAWLVFALWTLIAPSFHQRCSALKDPRKLKLGIFIAILIWFILDGLMTVTGLYAKLIFPDINPLYSYLYLANFLLPAVFKGAFMVGLLAFIMSTVDSNFHIISTTFGYDIVATMAPDFFKKHRRFVFAVGLIVAAIIAIIIATVMPSVIMIWYTIYSITLPVLFLPVIATYYGFLKLNPLNTLRVMSATAIVTLVWMIFGWLRGSVHQPEYLISLEPVYIGLVFSSFFYLIKLLHK